VSLRFSYLLCSKSEPKERIGNCSSWLPSFAVRKHKSSVTIILMFQTESLRGKNLNTVREVDRTREQPQNGKASDCSQQLALPTASPVRPMKLSRPKLPGESSVIVPRPESSNDGPPRSSKGRAPFASAAVCVGADREKEPSLSAAPSFQTLLAKAADSQTGGAAGSPLFALKEGCRPFLVGLSKRGPEAVPASVLFLILVTHSFEPDPLLRAPVSADADVLQTWSLESSSASCSVPSPWLNRSILAPSEDRDFSLLSDSTLGFSALCFSKGAAGRPPFLGPACHDPKPVLRIAERTFSSSTRLATRPLHPEGPLSKTWWTLRQNRAGLRPWR
jgi:hypothetical protein